MRLYTLIFLNSLFIINITFAQSVKVYSNTGTLVKNAIEISQGVKLKNDNSAEFIFAYKKDYITKGVPFNTIFKENSTEFKINLTPIVPLVQGFDSKIIAFAKIVDKTGKIPKSRIDPYYGYIQGVNLDDVELINTVNTYISEWGYNSIGGDSDIFKEKQKEPELIIAGEIINIEKVTKKTPGFMISVIVKWSVYNIEKEKVIYELTTAGYSNTYIAHKYKDELILSFKDAIVGLLADDGFVKYANKEKKISVDDNSSVEFLVLSKVPKSSVTDNTEIIKNSIKSVVTVKTEFGHGSGFIISKDGYAITNSHVVEDADNIEVIFNNGLILPAEVITNDKNRDVILLKIVGGGYHPLPMNTNGNDVEIGSEVIAIGTPKNIELGQTVSKGILSGYRNLEDKNYIQTDVSINLGSSGGPLLNAEGEVIGIIVAKIVGNDVEGLGFAIPIDEAVKGLNIKFE
ncbi:MAG: S1C family serine protease [Bacteroidales bacterium]|nr:S1C family serine protease [Bacteroidales bacterium]